MATRKYATLDEAVKDLGATRVEKRHHGAVGVLFKDDKAIASFFAPRPELPEQPDYSVRVY